MVSATIVTARTINGTVYSAFQQAAKELNLVTAVTDLIICFQQSLGMSTRAELRSLFASLTVNGFSTLLIYDNEILHRELMLDCLMDRMNLLQANKRKEQHVS